MWTKTLAVGIWLLSFSVLVLQVCHPKEAWLATESVKVVCLSPWSVRYKVSSAGKLFIALLPVNWWRKTAKQLSWRVHPNAISTLPTVKKLEISSLLLRGLNKFPSKLVSIWASTQLFKLIRHMASGMPTFPWFFQYHHQSWMSLQPIATWPTFHFLGTPGHKSHYRLQ